jgi:thymidylate synthase
MAYIPDLRLPRSNEDSLRPILQLFNTKISHGEIVRSPDGDVTAEIIGSVIQFDPSQKELNFGNIRKTNAEYVKKELDWYLSESLNIHPIMDDVKVWNKICGRNGEICSNYGWAIFSEENHRQYNNCLMRLLGNPLTKRAVMIYTRPSMWDDSKKNGMNDFMCTDGVQCQIVDNRLIYVVKQRSCDFIFGMFNDLAWHQWVYRRMMTDLSEFTSVKEGVIVFYPFNLHVYERHFNLIGQMQNYMHSLLRGDHDG